MTDSVSTPTTEPSRDAGLDSGAVQDDEYLSELGYKQELTRALGPFSSFAVQFSMVAVGSSVFTTLIVGLGFFGPASFWSYVIGGAGQMVVGLAVAELVSCYPLAGGVYQITNRLTRRPFAGFMNGWLMVIAHVASVPAIAVSIAPYVGGWFGWHLDSTTTKLLVLGLILLTTVVNLAGVRVAAMINNIGVVAELVGFAAVIICLIVVSHPWQGVGILTNTGGTTVHTSWIKAFAFALVLPAYIISSFDSTGNTAEETRDAARQAPRGVVTANFLSYTYGLVGIGLILLAIQNVAQVQGSAEPVKLILTQAVGHFVAVGMQDLAVIALFAAMVMLQLTAARVLWSQARDGQLPFAKYVKRVNRENIPHVAVFLTVVLAVIIVFWSSLLSVLLALTALAWAVAYLMVCGVGIPALRRGTLPRHPWGYGRWSMPIFVLAMIWSVALVAVLIWSNPKQVGLGILGALALGVVLYFLIPPSRRGKVPGLFGQPGTPPTANIEPTEGGVRITI
jgi:amino acid transporter